MTIAFGLSHIIFIAVLAAQLAIASMAAWELYRLPRKFSQPLGSRVTIVELLQKYLKWNTVNTHQVYAFLCAIKHWSKIRRINDAANGKMNSFGYVLMGLVCVCVFVSVFFHLSLFLFPLSSQ